MRAIVLLAATLALPLAPVAAHAKGAPVTAAEMCGAGGCRAIEEAPAELTGLLPEVAMVTADRTRRVGAPRDTPYLRIRLWLDEPHAPQWLRQGDLERIGTVEIDYAPGIDAVRLVDPPSEMRWARIDDVAATTLDRLAAGLVAIDRARQRSGRPDATAQATVDSDRASDLKPLAAGLGLLAFAGVGAAVVRRTAGPPS